MCLCSDQIIPSAEAYIYALTQDVALGAQRVFVLLGQILPYSASFMRLPAYGFPRRPLLETVWKIALKALDRLCLVAQESGTGYLSPVWAVCYAPNEPIFIFQTIS